MPNIIKASIFFILSLIAFSSVKATTAGANAQTKDAYGGWAWEVIVNDHTGTNSCHCSWRQSSPPDLNLTRSVFFQSNCHDSACKALGMGSGVSMQITNGVLFEASTTGVSPNGDDVSCYFRGTFIMGMSFVGGAVHCQGMYGSVLKNWHAQILN